MNNSAESSETRLKVAGGLVRLFEAAEDDKRLPLARLIELRLHEPQAFVTVVGETSTGKSTLINSLLTRPLLPVSAAPSTATVTQVILRNETESRFFAIYKDASQKDITPIQFRDLSLKPSDDLLRLQLRVRPAMDRYLGLQIFDTPGYNSLLAEHEEVLRTFLPESDVVIFVAGYRTGFGQVDQDLLEVAGSAVAYDESIPVIVAINRVAPDCTPIDRRVIEIMANVRDCLKREPLCVLIESAPLSELSEQEPAEPNAERLWSTVADLLAQPECKAVVDRKLGAILKSLIQDALADCERQECELTADDAERVQALAQISVLRDARNRSSKAVRQTTARLERTLPDIIRTGCEKLKHEMASTVDESDKWLGSEDCARWISIHKLPCGVREIGKEVEFQISAELERLDQDLNEIANTAVQRVQDEVEVKSDAAERFTVNLARTVLERVGGSAITNLLHGIGGAGGAAAGAGNLVKMVVSRAGNIFGKTFSREIYDNIGRTFTKKALGRLNVAVQIIIEVGAYLVHTYRWQGKLKERTGLAVDDWRDATIHELLNDNVVAIERRNLKGVENIYDDLIGSEAAADSRKREGLSQRLTAIRMHADALHSLVQLSSVHQTNESKEYHHV